MIEVESTRRRAGMNPFVKTPMQDPRRGRVMLRGQLLDAGYTDKAIARLVRDGEWVKLRHGAYTETRTWSGLDSPDQHALTARAVVAQAQTPVVVSHSSGLPFYDAPTWGVDLSAVHVTREDGKAGRSDAGLVQHCGEIIPGDVVVRDGLKVMSPTRLAIELTMVAETEPSLAVMNHLLHERLTTPELLTARYESMRRWSGTLGAEIVLRLARPEIESVGESRTFYLCFRAGLPIPEPQYEIRDSSGRLIGRVDFAWPELGVFLEFDGRIKYERLLEPGQRASDIVIAEKRREERICRITGWRCIRIVWSDLAQPARTAALIRDVLYPSTNAA